MKSINKTIEFALIEEDMNVGDPSYLHPDVEGQVDTHVSPVSEILPPKFLSMVASKRYNSLVSELEQITGKASPDWMAVMYQVMGAMSSIQQIEIPKKRELEKLAVDTILSLPEWEIIRDVNIKKGWLKIEATIIQPDFSKLIAEYKKSVEEKEPEEAAVAETEVFALIEGESKLKRDLANFITQGEAATGFHTYKLIKDQIDLISPKLYDLYKLFVIGGLINYFAGPLDLVQAATAIGSVEINVDGDEENIYVIKAEGVNFVLLMHEIIKGLYDYLAVDVGPNELEDINAERVHTNTGPGIAKIFRDRFLKVADSGIDDLKYFPLVLRILYGSDPETPVYGQDLKDIIAGKPAGMQILKDCIDKVKQHYLNKGNTEDDTGEDTGESDNADYWKS